MSGETAPPAVAARVVLDVVLAVEPPSSMSDMEEQALSVAMAANRNPALAAFRNAIAPRFIKPLETAPAGRKLTVVSPACYGLADAS
jgi:hypothetical protein